MTSAHYLLPTSRFVEVPIFGVKYPKKVIMDKVRLFVKGIKSQGAVISIRKKDPSPKFPRKLPVQQMK
jgi:hypothetical protein